MSVTGESKQAPTWAYIAGALIPIILAMGSYIFTTTAEANAKAISTLTAKEQEHDVAIAVIRQSLEAIQKDQARDSRTIEAIARKLNVITFDSPDR